MGLSGCEVAESIVCLANAKSANPSSPAARIKQKSHQSFGGMKKKV